MSEKIVHLSIVNYFRYLAVDAEGFCWGRNYREAGYYTSVFLW